MLNSCSYNNNVRTTLQTGIDNSIATVVIVQAVAPYNNPPTTASADKPAYFTLMDNPVNPTKIEIIRATGVSSPTLGVVTLTGVTRGVDGTTAQSWSVGSVVVQALNKAAANPAAISAIRPESFSGAFANIATNWEYVIATHGDGVCLKAISGMLSIDAHAIETTAFSANIGYVASLETASISATGTSLFTGSTIVSNLRLTAAAPPTAASPGAVGEVRVAGNFIYVCTATNTWRRAALSAW